MSGARIAEVESTLAASRAAADDRLVEVVRHAQRLELETAARGAETGRRRIAQIQAVAESVATQAAAIEAETNRLARIMATTYERLARMDAEMDFRAPRWQSEIQATVERNLEPGA